MLISLFEQSTVENRSALLSRPVTWAVRGMCLCLVPGLLIGVVTIDLLAMIALLNCAVFSALVRNSIMYQLLMIG